MKNIVLVICMMIITAFANPEKGVIMNKKLKKYTYAIEAQDDIKVNKFDLRINIRSFNITVKAFDDEEADEKLHTLLDNSSLKDKDMTIQMIDEEVIE